MSFLITQSGPTLKGSQGTFLFGEVKGKSKQPTIHFLPNFVSFADVK